MKRLVILTVILFLGLLPAKAREYAVSGPEEYITLEDYGAALEADRKNDEASKRKKEEKVRLERERLISDQPTLRECAKSLLSQLFLM